MYVGVCMCVSTSDKITAVVHDPSCYNIRSLENGAQSFLYDGYVHMCWSLIKPGARLVS